MLMVYLWAEFYESFANFVKTSIVRKKPSNLKPYTINALVKDKEIYLLKIIICVPIGCLVRIPDRGKDESNTIAEKHIAYS